MLASHWRGFARVRGVKLDERGSGTFLNPHKMLVLQLWVWCFVAVCCCCLLRFVSDICRLSVEKTIIQSFHEILLARHIFSDILRQFFRDSGAVQVA